MLSGDNSILQKAKTAKERTGIAEVVENAKLDVLAQIADNKGANISKDQLKAILSTYFEGIATLELPDDLSNTDIKLTANQTYGGYQNIALVDIYNGKFTTEPIEQDPVQVISYEDSFVGCYADVDGNGSIDGIVYADLLVGKPDSGSWSGCEWYSAVTYTLPTDVTESNVKDYIISDTAVTDSRFDSTPRDVICLSAESDGTKARFYVLNLEDVTNVATTQVGNLTGHIPSKEEWAMFGEAFGLNYEEGYMAIANDHESYFGLDTESDYLASENGWWMSARYGTVYNEGSGDLQRATVSF